MSSEPELVEITRPRQVLAYLAESETLFRPQREEDRRLHQRALRFWLDDLVRRGRVGLPPFFVADMIGRAGSEGRRPQVRTPSVPEAIRSLQTRYDRAMADLLRLARFESFFESSRLLKSLPDTLREFLAIIAQRVEGHSAKLPAFHTQTLADAIRHDTDRSPRTDDWELTPLWEAFVSGFEAAVAEWTREEGAAVTAARSAWAEAGIDVEALRLLLPATSPDTPAVWDYTAIEQTLRGLREPPLAAPEEQRLRGLLPNVRMEQVRVRSRLPQGGFVGLRPNGGIEEIDSVAPSELALPRLAFLEKAFNRRLNVFERPLQRVSAQNVHLCFLFFEAGDPDRPAGSGALSPRAEAASILVRTIFGIWDTFRRCQTGDFTAHLFLPAGPSSFDLARIADDESSGSLPFFLDRERTAGLPSLFLLRMVGAQGSQRSADEEHHAMRQVVEQADSTHVLCLSTSETSLAADEAARFAEQHLALGSTAADSLFDARLSGAGWSLATHGMPRGSRLSGLAPTSLIRELLTRLLRRLLHINIAHLSR